jgi:uncharacterized protein (TIGR00106 family)
MDNRIIAEIAVVPIGTGKPGVSHFVAACLDVLDANKQVKFQLTPMGTILEGSIEAVLAIARQMHEIPFNKGAQRVITTLKIDDRRDKHLTMAGKVNAVRKIRSTTERF